MKQHSKNQTPVLEIDDLSIAYETRKGDVNAVNHISFKLNPAETLGIVGESGCGKSTVSFGIVGFLGRNGKITNGTIKFNNENLINSSKEELRSLRGNQIAMVYQDPTQALNPSVKIGLQLLEAMVYHQHLPIKESRDRAIEVLKKVHMPDPQTIMKRYPHQLSGGQLQRVVIAMALLNNPSLLIMDEPTTALDVTVEASVLDLIEELKSEYDTAILFISHNLGVVAQVSDNLAVMYAGEIVEQGPLTDIFKTPSHPYTKALLKCLPKLGQDKTTETLFTIPGSVPEPSKRDLNRCIYAPRCEYAQKKCTNELPINSKLTEAHFVKCFFVEKVRKDGKGRNSEQNMNLTSFQKNGEETSTLDIRGLKTYYRRQSDSILSSFGIGQKRYVKALDGITFEAPSNKTFSIVGESGCGKSTFLKTIIGLEKSKAGEAEYLGYDLTLPLKKRDLNLIKNMQMVFQNPDSTLNPSFSIGSQIARRLKRFKLVPKNEIKTKVLELLKTVRLDDYYYDRLPRQLSGGEKQRVAIARALASEPFLMLCDEPLSALDVSVQASIINLLKSLQDQFNTTIILISHDLSVVRYISDVVAVMYMGKLMEIGLANNIYSPPYHPYTESLLSSVPSTELNVKKRKIRLTGNVPSALNPPSGCPFHTRCPRRFDMLDDSKICEEKVPTWQVVSDGHKILCHIPSDTLESVGHIIYQK